MNAGPRFLPLAMFGWVSLASGLTIFIGLSGLYLPISLLFPATRVFFEAAVWQSGAPVFLGLMLILTDLVFIYPLRRKAIRSAENVDIEQVTVVLTAFDDEDSIAGAVEDFRKQPMVKRVVVVDNASEDSTAERAVIAGATVVEETRRGYGYAVHRALEVGASYRDTSAVVLSEGDGTFSGDDIVKLLAYAQHADIVVGSRISDLLREHKTQLTPFMYWGNFFAAKILESKHLGRVTLSDLGTTYKLVRSEVLRRGLEKFDPRVNLEFNAHFLDVAIGEGLRVVEVPITFFRRIGYSKGGNVSNFRALRVGLTMMVGILFSWKLLVRE